MTDLESNKSEFHCPLRAVLVNVDAKSKYSTRIAGSMDECGFNTPRRSVSRIEKIVLFYSNEPIYFHFRQSR